MPYVSAVDHNYWMHKQNIQQISHQLKEIVKGKWLDNAQSSMNVTHAHWLYVKETLMLRCIAVKLGQIKNFKKYSIWPQVKLHANFSLCAI